VSKTRGRSEPYQTDEPYICFMWNCVALRVVEVCVCVSVCVAVLP